mgnify:CR=1
MFNRNGGSGVPKTSIVRRIGNSLFVIDLLLSKGPISVTDDPNHESRINNHELASCLIPGSGRLFLRLCCTKSFSEVNILRMMQFIYKLWAIFRKYRPFYIF